MRAESSYSFSNREIAKILKNITAAYTVKNESRFRIAAYERAAVSVEHATSELKDLWDDGKLDQIPGIGKSLASSLDELFRTGKVRHFDKIMKGLPTAMFTFLDIPGIGPKTAYVLAKKLKIFKKEVAIDKLKKAALEGKIRIIENFGEKSEQDILEGIKALKKGELKTKRMLLPYADLLASEIIDYLKNSPFVLEAHPLGSLRRMVATIGDIDISVCTERPEKVIEYFENYQKIKTVLEKGEKALLRVVLTSGQQVDLRFSSPESYGAMLQYFTGSKQHNIDLREFALKKGMSLSEYGIKLNKKLNISKLAAVAVKNKKYIEKIKKFSNEEDFYRELRLEWIPPELREAQGEIEAAKSGKLPKLVELADIKGDLHLHSDFPIEPSHDLGASSPEVMIEKATMLGYEYLGFSEHNPSSSNHTKKEILDLLKRKKEYFEQLSYSENRQAGHSIKKLPIKVLSGLEIDIKPGGDLSIPKEGLDLLDFVIVSIHTNFNLSKEKMTERVLRGLSNPRAKILGHPTGRLLEEREGYELNWEKIFDFCLKNNKILEVSAWPNRLDLPDVLVREAVRLGVKLIIDSDSHSVEQMSYMKYGVAVARRGWAEKKDIINTLSYGELSGILF